MENQIQYHACVDVTGLFLHVELGVQRKTWAGELLLKTLIPELRDEEGGRLRLILEAFNLLTRHSGKF